MSHAWDRTPPTPTESLMAFIEALEERVESARVAINNGYEEIGRYSKRRDDALVAIEETKKAIQAIQEAAS